MSHVFCYSTKTFPFSVILMSWGPWVRDRKLSEDEGSLISTLSGCTGVLAPPSSRGLALPALCQRVSHSHQTPPTVKDPSLPQQQFGVFCLTPLHGQCPWALTDSGSLVRESRRASFPFLTVLPGQPWSHLLIFL